MSTHRVTILPEGQSISVPSGRDLLSALIEAGLPVVQGCGGKGICGRCEVELLSPKKGIVLACQTLVESDLEVFVPPSTRIGYSSFDMDRVWESPLPTAIQSAEPLVRQVDLSLTPPTLDDNASDLDRVKSALGTRDLEVPNLVLIPFPSLLRAENWKVSAFVEGNRLIDIDSQGSRCLGIAIDLGTTTLAAVLVDLTTGMPIAAAGCLNPQMKYGADIISRIIYAGCGDKDETLGTAATRGIRRLCRALTKRADEVRAVTIAGNTTMMHLLFEVNPANIRREPYVPAFLEYPPVTMYSMPTNVGAYIHSIRGVSSYVGGDITAGVYATGLSESDEMSVLMDLGTNGEIVVGNKEWMVCCSASAGPCFEGGGITSGSPAVPGAIDRVNPDLTYSVIGDCEPVGICGSGLVDLLAVLFERGILDKQGKFIPGSSPNLQEAEWGTAYALDREHNIILSEADVANLIRAKAAIYAGLETALDFTGTKMEYIRRVFVAGGMGSFIHVPSAITIGLFPNLPEEVFIAAGNTSLQGAYMALTSRDGLDRCREIANSMTNIELGVEPGYADRYSAALFLPHTDLSRFKRS